LIYHSDSASCRHNIYGLSEISRTTCPLSPSIPSRSPVSPISRARFSDDLLRAEDHVFLDSLDEAHARIFAAEQGYDLVDDQGMLTDWWGFCWMILAEKRGLLTPENRAAARAAIEEKYLSAPNVIGVIVGR